MFRASTRLLQPAALSSVALLTGYVMSNNASSDGGAASKTKLELKAVDQQTNADHIRSLSPIAPFRILSPNPHLEICYDTRTRNAVYVQHRVVPNDEKSTGMRRPRFYEDKSIENVYRSKDSLYISSGYDRGHLAPAADFTADNQQFNDTFNLCNVSPQDAEMNRKIWAKLEDWTRTVASRAAKEQDAVTYATTGPLWLPRVKVDKKTFLYNVKGIGEPPMLVQIPTHFFKVVVVVDKAHTRILEFACFVMPNDSSANNRMIQDYVVPWSDLETVTGLRFFPQLVDAAFLKSADSLSLKTNARLDPNDQSMKLLTDGKVARPNKGWSSREKNSFSHLCDTTSCKIHGLPQKK